jgi:poly(A) polymerase
MVNTSMWTRIDKAFPVPGSVRSILNALYDSGHEAYLVGGCVRDFFLGREMKDYDIATSASPDEVEQLFPKTLAVGKAFGVMKVLAEDAREVEVATFRKDGPYSDHRRPAKVEFGDVRADGERRDFTINALYFDLKTNRVLDFFGGLEDLRKKVLRAIGNPEERFREDALRLLRAVRFSSRFQFTIEEGTRLAMIEKSPLIRKISVERVRDELERMLTHGSARSAVAALDELGLLENVMPEISVGKLSQRKVWDQTLRVLSVLGQYSQKEPSGFYWGLFLLPTLRLLPVEKREMEARKIAARLKLSNECSDQMAYLVRETPKFRDAFSMREATLLRWMRHPDFELLVRFHELDAVSYDGNLAGLEFVRSIYPEAKRRFEVRPLITGEDLVKLGMQPGPKFTEILRGVEDLTLEGQLTSAKQALEYVLTHFVR